MNPHVKTIITILTVALIITAVCWFPITGMVILLTSLFVLAYYWIYLFWKGDLDNDDDPNYY